MPKQTYKIEQFHGGLNNNSDPRDIADNELSTAQNVMVDEIGKIRLASDVTADTYLEGGLPGAASDGVGGDEKVGFGLFSFSHDRTGGNLVTSDLSGTHTGSDNEVVELTDSAAAFTSVLVGATVNNTTDGSSGTVASVDSGTVLTLDDLTGGTGDEWDTGDTYTITNFPETGDDYLVVGSDANPCGLVIYSNTDDEWSSGVAVNVGTNTGFQPIISFINGALRVSDYSFSNTNKWYGYIKRTHFNGKTPGGTADGYDQWHEITNDLAAPTRGLCGDLTATYADGSSATNLQEHGFFAEWSGEVENSHKALNTTEKVSDTITVWVNDHNVTTSGSTVNWTNDTFHIYPPAGEGFNLNLSASGTDGTLTADTYEFATTFIYDEEPGEVGAQESLLFTTPGTLVVAATEHINLQVYATSPYDPRITGGRVYMRSSTGDEQWMMLAEISLKDGVRAFPTDNYSAWFYTDGDNNATTVHLANASQSVILREPPIIDYETNTGFPQNTPSITAKYSTTDVVGAYAYIGNVKRDNGNGEVVESDKIYKSLPFKYDTFPSNNYILSDAGDGESIVRIISFADRLLQFKQNTLTIINLTNPDIPFIEATYKYKGVRHQAAVCKTDFGIAWVNKDGCYLYNGKDVMNLLEKKGRQLLKTGESATTGWYDFMYNDSGTELDPMIGYLPKKRQLVVFSSVDNSASHSDPIVYIYDLVTGSWVNRVYDPLGFPDKQKTNAINDWGGRLLIGEIDSSNNRINIIKWNMEPAGTNHIKITTKDIDFGQPSQRKKIYKVYVTFKSTGATNIEVYYDVDGGISFGKQFQDGDYFTSNKLLTTAGAWEIAELKPATSSEANNIKSIRLRFKNLTASDTPSDFEINDISIVYRAKSIK